VTTTRYIPVSDNEKLGTDGFANVDENDGGTFDQLYVTPGESTTVVSNRVLPVPRHNGELLDAHTVGLCLIVTIVMDVSGTPAFVLITENVPLCAAVAGKMNAFCVVANIVVDGAGPNH
jgi:hypothetical protein